MCLQILVVCLNYFHREYIGFNDNFLELRVNSTVYAQYCAQNGGPHPLHAPVSESIVRNEDHLLATVPIMPTAPGVLMISAVGPNGNIIIVPANMAGDQKAQVGGTTAPVKYSMIESDQV